MTPEQHLEAVETCNRLMHTARKAYFGFAKDRRLAIRRAVAAGVHHGEIAQRLNVSPGMVTKLLKVSGTGRAGSPVSSQPPRGGMGTPAEELASPPVPES